MAATLKKKMCERSREFYDRIGRLRVEEIFRLGLPYDTLMGTVMYCNVNRYLAFCEANPDYHVISFPKGRVVNRFIDDGRCNIYMLGDGDPDPELELILDYAALKVELFEILEAGGPERAQELAYMKKMLGEG